MLLQNLHPIQLIIEDSSDASAIINGNGELVSENQEFQIFSRSYFKYQVENISDLLTVFLPGIADHDITHYLSEITEKKVIDVEAYQFQGLQIIINRLTEFGDYLHIVFKQHDQKTSQKEILKLYQEATFQSKDAVLVTEPVNDNEDFEIIFSNPSFQVMLEYTAKEILGKPLSFFFSTNRNKFAELIKNVREGEKYNCQMVTYSRSGSVVITDWSVSPILNNKGQVMKNLYIIRNITEIIKSENDLLKQQVNFRAIIESTQNAIVLLDNDNTIKSYNTRFRTIVGFDLVPTLVASNISHFIAEESFAEIKGLIRRVQKGKTSRKDLKGLFGQAENWYQVTANPVQLDKKVEGVVLNFREITKEKEQEAELNRNRERLRSLFNNVAEGIVLHDKDGKVIDHNRSAETALGFTEGQLLGKDPLDRRWKAIDKNGNPIAGTNHPAMRSLNKGEIVNQEIMGIHRPDGRRSWISVNSRPIFNENNVISGAIASFNDITTLVQRSDELKKSEQSYKKLYERHLKDQRKIASIIRNSEVAFWSTDLEGNLDYVEGSLLNIFQENQATLIGTSILKPIKVLSKHNFDKVLQGKYHKNTVEFRGRFLTNEFTALEDDRGKVIGVSGFTIDVTDIVRAKQAYKNVTEQMLHTQKAAKIGFWSFDVKRKEPYLSEVVKEIYGVDKPYQADFEADLKFYHPEDQFILRNAVNRLMKHQEPYDLEVRVIDNKGNLKWTRCIGLSKHDNRGKCIELYGTIHDITARKKAELKNESFKKLYELSAELASIATMEGKFEFLNPAWQKTLGYTEQEMLDLPVENLIHEDDFNFSVIEMQALLSGEKDRLENFKNRYRTKDGNYRWLLWSSVIDREGQRIYSVARDISEIEKNSRALEQSVFEKEVLLKEIHHRVKNNLQMVSSLLYLKSSSIMDEDIKRFFLESQGRINAITFIHEKLLQTSSFKDLETRTFLESLIQSIIQINVTEYKKINVSTEIENIILPTDVVMNLGLLVNELLSNSFEHAFKDRSEGNFKLSFYQKDEDYYLEIKDDGSGLIRDNDPGKGIGLQLVNIFVKQINGEIDFKTSEGLLVTIKFNSKKNEG